jgi:hypothetical protein
VRHAGPVTVVCQGRGWRALQASLFGLAAFALVSWLVQRMGRFDPTLVFGMGGVAAVLAACASWWFLLAAPKRLTWDGQQWLLEGQSVGTQLKIDFGPALLFRVEAPHAAACWLLATRHEAGTAWHALRVAAHAPAAA